jgi:preprotein translocase subunit SecE
VQETVQQGSVVTEEAATPEQLARHAQRREERRAAKARSEKRGVARVVNSERFSGSRAFYNDASSEIRKVIWPDRMQTRNLTLLVIALSIVMGVLLGGIDWTLLQLFEAIG